MAMASRTPNKSIGLISKQTTLHVQHTFLYISLRPFCTTALWNFLVTCFVGKKVYVFLFIFFSTDASLKHFSFCHFPIKLSCLPSNEIHLLWFFISHYVFILSELSSDTIIHTFCYWWCSAARALCSRAPL